MKSNRGKIAGMLVLLLAVTLLASAAHNVRGEAASSANEPQNITTGLNDQEEVSVTVYTAILDW
jgi:ABC-type glycerol-3-phosphate transport system substrate-binding protein